MIMGHMRRVSILALSLVLACGGAIGKGPDAAHGGGANGADDSIGDLAARQGGLLGSTGGGYESSGVNGSFKLDLVEQAAPVKLDGTLREWPARAPAKTAISGTASGTVFSCALQYDDSRIYFGGEVTTSGLYRTARFGDDEDHASLVIAFPSTGALSAVEVGVYAGKPGESAGVVKYASGPMKGQQVPGAKIVEAPMDKGYSFEASIPWSAFPEARTTRVGLRGAGRYYDAQGSSGIKAVLATSQGDVGHPVDLAALPMESEQSLIEQYLTPKGLLAATPRADVYADINGDGTKERIAVFEHTVTVVGSTYRGGKEFFYRDLGADLVRLDARDVTGRGREDLLIRRKFAGSSEREWLEVWSFFSDEPTTTFAHEMAITSGDKQIVNAARVGNKEIEITYEPAKVWDATTYREPTASDVAPVLLPWGAVRSQTFRFEGQKFTKSKEVAQTPTGPAAVVTAVQQVKPPEPATPTVQRNADVSGSLLDKYKSDQHVAADVRPKVSLEVHVDGDARPEKVVLIGKDIVVFGPGFKGGSAYAFITLSQFADAADVKELTARDLTGDGAADLIVRGVRHVSAAGQGSVDMDVMFVYQVKGETLTRVFSIESGREQSGKRVQGLVQFVPSADGKHFEVDVRPGRATGWTDKTYPWAQDQPGSGALEPLLLPWGKIDHLRYAFNGTQFAKTP